MKHFVAGRLVTIAQAGIMLVLLVGCKSTQRNSMVQEAPRTNEKSLQFDERLRLVQGDLLSMKQDDRQDARYIDFSNLLQSGVSDTLIQEFKSSLTYALNSTSMALRVNTPTAIGTDKAVYRIDLNDFGWDAAAWENLVAPYPYAALYNNSLGSLTAFIRKATGSQVPMVQADWLLQRILATPTYYSLLQMPATITELESYLGLNLVQDIYDKQVWRAGFLNSAVAKYHRVIERHELPGNQGPIWVTYDFGNQQDQDNVWVEPVELKPNLQELLFSLPNGLIAYYVVDAQGQRLDQVPIGFMKEAVRDGTNLQVATGCMSCHLEKGILPHDDQLRDSVLTNGHRDLDKILTLYPKQDELRELFVEDQSRYRDSFDFIVKGLSHSSLRLTLDHYKKPLNLVDVAAVLGMAPFSLRRALDEAPQKFPAAWLALREQRGVLSRETFEKTFPALALGLGGG